MKDTAHTRLHLFNSPLSRTIRVSQYQKGKTNLDLLEQETEVAVASAGHMQICTLPQTDNHASIPPLILQARCSSCHLTNSIKALKANETYCNDINITEAELVALYFSVGLFLPTQGWYGHIHTQQFYGSMDFVRDNRGEPVPEETFNQFTHMANT